MDVKTAYEQWLHDFAADADTIADLKAIANDPAEIEDRFYTELSFGTAGMRGVLGAGMNRMNRYNVRRATKGLSKYLLQNPQEAQRGVVIAYDSRRFSAEFARDTALVLAQEGVPAYLFDALRPVPILSYAVRHLHAIAGIVITASHNPPQYNGYKVYAEDGAQVGPEAADGITAFIRSTPYTDCKLMDEEEAKAKGLLKIIGNKEVDDDYIAQVKTLCIQPELLAEEGSKLSIVYTPIHGSGNVPVRRILREVGISNVSVVKEQELPDPNFSTVKVPNPEDPGAFVLAIKLADEVGAKVIFATDPDCDRLGVAVQDRQWRLAAADRQPDRLCAAALHSLHQAEAGNAAQERRGGEVHRVHVAGEQDCRLLRRGDVRDADGLQVYRREDSAVPGHRLSHVPLRLRGELRLPVQHVRARQGRRERLPADCRGRLCLRRAGHHAL